MRSAKSQPAVSSPQVTESSKHEEAGSQSAPRESGGPAAAGAPLPSPAKPEHTTAAPSHADVSVAAEASGRSIAEPEQNVMPSEAHESLAHETAAPAFRSLHAADVTTAPDIASTDAATPDVSAAESASVLNMELDKLNAQAEHAEALPGATAQGSASASQTPSLVPIPDAAQPDIMTASSPASAAQTPRTLPAAGQQNASVSGVSSGAKQLPAGAGASTTLPSMGQGPPDGLEGVSAEARQQLQQLAGLGASIIALPDKREGTMGQGTAAPSSSADASAHADADPVAAGTIPAATAAAEPPLEPPGECVSFQGLRAGP